ncbi:uncharacterized protein RHO17_006530 isoform 1-T1 [Thomomys bottae]
MSSSSSTSLTSLSTALEYHPCSLPELYLLMHIFNKECKKSSLLKTQSISLKEAQKLLAKNLNAMTCTHGTEARSEDSEIVYTCPVVKKERRSRQSMAELSYQRLLIGITPSMERLPDSCHRLVQLETSNQSFHYIILKDPGSVSQFIIRKMSSMGLRPQMVFDDRLPKYTPLEPEHQFQDLQDLQQRYLSGFVKLKRTPRILTTDIIYDTEKRFVKSQDMPPVFLPLLHKPLVISQDSLKRWNLLS